MTRGGKRQGAGRPKLYNSPTKAVRLPVNEIASVKYYLNNKTPFKLPMYSPIVEKQLADATQAKNLFLSIVAHEVKGPLANTIYILKMLKEKLQNNTINLEECFAMIDAEIKDANRGIETIHYLLDFFNLHENSYALTKKITVDVRQDLMQIIDIFEQKNEKQLTFTVTKDKNFPHSININPLFYEVVTILLHNAVMYSYETGKIVIRFSHTTQNKQKYLHIVIADHGVGINKEMVDRLFSPLFDKESETADSLYRSPAIKLSYARKIAELLGGSLTIESEGCNKGTQASFTIPYENHIYSNGSALILKCDEENIAMPVAQRKLAILVVEDNPVTAYLLQKELLSIGHEVTSAADAFEARRYIETVNFDLIFMDISLPGVDGIELRHLISEPQCDKPIFIAVTSHHSEKDINFFLDHGFVTVINKPFTRDDIVDCLNTVQNVLNDLEH